MILSTDQAAKVKAGRKTQLTRPRARAGKLKVGHTYPVQVEVTERDDWSHEVKLRRETRCWILVNAVASAYLYEASDDDARAEGFKDREAFFAWWQERYNQRAYVDCASGQAPVSHEVVVVRFRLDEKRFLADSSRGIPTDPRGYVHTASDPLDAGEAIDEETQDAYSLEADQTALLEGGRRERHRRETWSEGRRLDRINELARLHGADVSSDLRVIRKRLERMEEKLGRRAA